MTMLEDQPADTRRERESARAVSVPPQRVFVVVAGVIALLLTFLTPPMQVPDEEGHLFRAYQVSHGIFYSARMGADTPDSLLQLAGHFQGIKIHADRKATWAMIHDELGKPLNPGQTTFLGLPGASIYSPVPYTGQAVGMAIGRRLGWSPLGLMYAGRVGNVLVYVLLGWAAIRLLPILKWPACIILTAPLPLMLAGSLSADPITTGLAFLTVALLLRLALVPGVAHPAAKVGLLAAMVGVSLCKSVYLPIVVLLCVVPRERWGGGARRWVWPAVIVLAAVAASATWSALASPLHVHQRSNPQEQKAWLEHHPIEFVIELARTLRLEGKAMAGDAFGHLGWGEFDTSQHFYDAFFFGLIWMVWQDDSAVPLPARVRAAAAVTAGLCVLAIAAAVCILWRLPDDPYMKGMQGRYFLLVGFLGCVALRRRGHAGITPGWMVTLLSVEWAYALWLMVERFYVPGG